ncbi:DUF3023 domain-containing protein [Ehrlichia chaffeensis]|uniref:DUF3023 domain-containing protein n=1 Tax=Ehrlichia chaffeensis TaxID=945 RepID=UPI0003170FA2|nr:DUF3023 domain-containing protein [Ehrlichia chaffeensis]AHX05505.1 hypothetical protein ECHJAX_0435 [Ehrlichia chaffeensis str. Jax]
MFSKMSLEDQKKYNDLLCKKVTSLPFIEVSGCFVIGTTDSNGELNVRVTKTHVDQEQIPFGTQSGNKLILMKCRMPSSFVMEEEPLRNTINPIAKFSSTFEVNMYFLVNDGSATDFFLNVWRKTHYRKYKRFANFCGYGKFVYARVRTASNDKDFDEFEALANVAQLKANFTVQQEIKGLLSSKKKVIVRSTIDGSELGAVGGEGIVGKHLEMKEVPTDDLLGGIFTQGESKLGAVGGESVVGKHLEMKEVPTDDLLGGIFTQDESKLGAVGGEGIAAKHPKKKKEVPPMVNEVITVLQNISVELEKVISKDGKT